MASTLPGWDEPDPAEDEAPPPVPVIPPTARPVPRFNLDPGKADHDPGGLTGPTAEDRAAEHRVAILAECTDRLTNHMAEAGIVGAALVNARAFEAVCGFLAAEHFTDELHRVAWETVAGLHEAGAVVDGIAAMKPLARNIARAGIRAGGGWSRAAQESADGFAKAAVAMFMGAMVPPGQATGYARTLVELWQRREALKLAMQLLDDAVTSPTIDDLLTDNAGRLDDLRAVGRMRDELRPIGDTVEAAMAAAELARARDGVPGVRCGDRQLDRLLGGMRPGNLIVLAARPGMGKSAKALGWCKAIGENAVAAIRAGEESDGGAVMFALEMDDSSLGGRYISLDLGIASQPLASGDLDEREWVQMSELRERLRGLPVWIDDRPKLTVAQMKLAVRRKQRRHKIGLVVVDHIQIVAPSADLRRAGRTEQLEGISGDLKAMAKELGVPVVALSQLSREVDKRPENDRRPVLPDLRGSGTIEQDADSVIFMYREHYYAKQKKPEFDTPLDSEAQAMGYVDRDNWQAEMRRLERIAEVIVAKNRHGATGTIGNLWTPERMMFTEAVE